MTEEHLFVNDVVRENDRDERDSKLGLVRAIEDDVVKVIWYPESKIESRNVDQVNVVHRFHKLGGKVMDANGDMGEISIKKIVIDAKVLNTDETIPSIPAESLTSVESMPITTRVLFRGWIGKVLQVTKRVELSFSDGSRCSVNLKELQNFVGNVFRQDNLVFPGQGIAAPWFTLKEATWTVKTIAIDSMLENMPLFLARVTAIKVVSYDVEWLCPFQDLDSSEATSSSNEAPRLTSVFATDVEHIDIPDYYRLSLGSIRKYEQPERTCFVECIYLKTTLEVVWEKDNSKTEVNSTDVISIAPDLTEVHLPFGYIRKSYSQANVSPPNAQMTRNASTAPAIPKPKFPAKFYKFFFLPTAPTEHTFYNSRGNINSRFANHVQREICILQTTLPSGIWVKGYEDRLDLFSIIIEGPEKTPYEDMVFIFDAKLPPDYPQNPPSFHYLTYTRDYCNPNLYQDGKVCVSLLGTWSGSQEEKWNPQSSNLLQVLASIQALILVPEPYFNEPGYEASRNTARGTAESTKYNQRVVFNMVLAAQKMLQSPPFPWEAELRNIIGNKVPKLLKRIHGWLEEAYGPEFPILPFSGDIETAIGAELHTLETLYSTFSEETATESE